jgi:hypothetical protein
MPVERKPLFRAEIVAPQAAAQTSDSGIEDGRAIFRRWAELVSSPRAEKLTESELLPDFLTDVYLGLRSSS